MAMDQNESMSSTEPAAATAQTIAMSELDAGQGARAGDRPLNGRGEMSNPLRHVRVRLTVAVGGAELTIGELLDAKAHQVIRLDQAVEQPVDVLLEGQVVA